MNNTYFINHNLSHPHNLEIVLLLIENQEGRILFVHRSPEDSDQPNSWSVVSGAREAGDSNIGQTIIREAFEELGVKIINYQELMAFQSEHLGTQRSVHAVRIPFNCYEGVPTIRTGEFDYMVWMNLGDFVKIHSENEVAAGLRDYIKLDRSNTQKERL